MTETILKTISKRKILAGILGLGLLALSACGGGSSSSGPAPPLPNSQKGSLELPTSYNPGDCYITTGTTTSTCNSPDLLTTGSSSITALAAYSAVSSSSPNVLFWGDAAGDIDSATAASSPTSITSCTSTSLATPVLALAVVPPSSSSGLPNGEIFYATSGGTYAAALASGACSTSVLSSPTTVISQVPTVLAYNASANQVIGISGDDLYYSCTPVSSGQTCTSQGTLPGLVDTSPQITAIASDPQLPIVYVLAIGVNTGRIYPYLVNSNGTLTSLGNYNGNELQNPVGLTLFQGDNGAQSYCSTQQCTFLDVLNKGNDTVTQYIVTYSTSSTGLPTGVSINQFNNAYTSCELIQPSAIAALPLPASSGTLNKPEVFIGEGGIQTGPCLGGTATSFGNNITAYDINGE